MARLYRSVRLRFSGRRKADASRWIGEDSERRGRVRGAGWWLHDQSAASRRLRQFDKSAQGFRVDTRPNRTSLECHRGDSDLRTRAVAGFLQSVISDTGFSESADHEPAEAVRRNHERA